MTEHEHDDNLPKPCGHKATLFMGGNTEVDVTCGLDEHDDDTMHFARDSLEVKSPRVLQKAQVTFRW